MNREIANLISEEVSESIARIAQIANGVLAAAPAIRPNTENPIPNTESCLPLSPSPRLPVRVYATPPNQTAIEFMINHALGMPGAQIEVTNTTESASRKLQSAKDRENGVVIKDHSILMLACEQQFKEFLPTAIDRLLELAAGVTVQYTHKHKTLTITHRPGARSIDYITSRTEGRFASVLSDLREKFENPNLNYPYTTEDFDAMTQAERDALYECALRTAAKSPNTTAAPTFDGDHLPSNSASCPLLARHERSGEGKGEVGIGTGVDGGEGYSGEGLPAHISTANKRLVDFLPQAITLLKALARGAQTVITTDSEQDSVEHGPDLKANMYLVNRFLGAPSTVLNIENIKQPMSAISP